MTNPATGRGLTVKPDGSVHEDEGGNTGLSFEKAMNGNLTVRGPKKRGRPRGSVYWTAGRFHRERNAAIARCHADNVKPTPDQIMARMDTLIGKTQYYGHLKKYPETTPE
jgi:hypothetical protein